MRKSIRLYWRPAQHRSEILHWIKTAEPQLLIGVGPAKGRSLAKLSKFLKTELSDAIGVRQTSDGQGGIEAAIYVAPVSAQFASRKP